MSSDTASAASGTDQTPAPTALEWSVRLISLAVVAALLGFIVLNGLNPSRPPDFDVTVHTDQIERRGDRWAVPVSVHNTGTVSVEGLVLQLELRRGAETIETATATIDLLGRGAHTDLEFWFTENPAPHEITANIGGSLLP